MSYVNNPYILEDKVNLNFLWVTLSFCGISYFVCEIPRISYLASQTIEIQLPLITIVTFYYKSNSGWNLTFNILESKANLLDVTKHFHPVRSITVNSQSSNKLPKGLWKFQDFRGSVYWRAMLKKVAFMKVLDFLILRECKIIIKNLNMEMGVRNSNKKTRYF